MEIIETKFDKVKILVPKIFSDNRGYFLESYNMNSHSELGLNYNFIQDNESMSEYGVIRGLHFQTGQFAQTKLVRVIKGAIIDIMVDIQTNSPNYGESFSIELNSENKRQLLIPKGFAHGFSVISEKAIVLYKCDNYYNRKYEGQINPLCNKLNLDWQLPIDDIKMSDKDKNGPSFGEHIPH